MKQKEERRCINCEAVATPLWRRSMCGESLCNACGLYYKNHHAHRPIRRYLPGLETATQPCFQRVNGLGTHSSPGPPRAHMGQHARLEKLATAALIELHNRGAPRFPLGRPSLAMSSFYGKPVQRCAAKQPEVYEDNGTVRQHSEEGRYEPKCMHTNTR
ncbi:hypothetical protein PAPHI01_1626 [Pancytospora philotis]|nr:hypothetical protein PAPHI01_1626 [Pancytospora philotis]